MTTPTTMPSRAEARYAEVLMPVDFSPLSWRVLPLARDLAARFGAELLPLHVDTASPWREPDDGSRLSLTASPFGRHIDIDVIAAQHPVDGIARFATRHPASFIAMSAHGHTGLGEMAFGSVWESVLREVDVPVLTVGPVFDVAKHSIVRRIVACVDETVDSQAIVTDAVAWARALGVPLELVTAIPKPAPDEWLPEQDRLSRLRAEEETIASTGMKVSSLVLFGGRPAHEIVGYAESVPGTLVAMATHARAAMPRSILGSVTAHVLRHTTAGILLRRRAAPVRL